MMHLKSYTKKELQEFISSGDFKKYDFLPITEHRGNSQIVNPKASETDVLLTLAFVGEKLAGYLGTLPDEFKTNDETIKFAWLSTLYVSEHFRGKRIAQKLLDSVFEQYNNFIAITEFTKEAESLYNKVGKFSYIDAKLGKRFYLQSDLKTILPTKKPKTKSLSPFLKVTDLVTNQMVRTKNILVKKPKFRFEIQKDTDTEILEFLNKFSSHRSGEEIAWFINNPWILEQNSTEANYLFSSYSSTFAYHWIKMKNESNEVESVALLQEREGHLKIPYVFSKTNLEKISEVVSYYSKKKKIKFITSYQTELNPLLSKKLTKLFSKNFERRYMFSKELKQKMGPNFDPKFQDGDGDCALT